MLTGSNSKYSHNLLRMQQALDFLLDFLPAILRNRLIQQILSRSTRRNHTHQNRRQISDQIQKSLSKCCCRHLTSPL
jgi:hypothetical protein